MDIEIAKDLCLEHDRLKKIVKTIEGAISKNTWVMIKTPNNEAYISDIQIKSVYDLARDRIKEIEKELRY